MIGSPVSVRISIDDLASRHPDDDQPVVLTSPRSIKVCLDHGVEPEMLVPKALADFAKPGLSREHQRLKWEHYESIRRERIEVLSRARDRLPVVPLEEATRVPGVEGAASSPGWTSRVRPLSPRMTSPGRLDSPTSPVGKTLGGSFVSEDGEPVMYSPGPGASGGVLKSTAFEEEQNRMLAARRKAQKQVEVMEQNALKKLERQAAAEEKVRRAKELERQRAHKKALEDQKKANETFIKLQQLKLNQEKLEKDKQRRAAEKHERELELKRLREAAERRARQEKKEKEELRRQRNAEFQARVDAMRAEKNRKIAHKARLMEEKEAARLTARRKEEQEIAAKNQAIHLFQAQKCEQAIMRSEQTTEQFRNKTMKKTTAADMRWKDLTSKKAAKIQGMRSKLSERSQYVLSRNQAAKDIEQKRINALIERAEKEEERIKLIADRRKREAAMETLVRSLSVEERREKVECMKRYKEYQQAQLLEKIERDTARTVALQSAKEELRRQRREENMRVSLDIKKMQKEIDLRALRSSARSKFEIQQMQKDIDEFGHGGIRSRPGTAGPSSVSSLYRTPVHPREVGARRPGSARPDSKRSAENVGRPGSARH